LIYLESHPPGGKSLKLTRTKPFKFDCHPSSDLHHGVRQVLLFLVVSRLVPTSRVEKFQGHGKLVDRIPGDDL